MNKSVWEEVSNAYFEWLCNIVCKERYPDIMSYRKLLGHLANVQFKAHRSTPLDENREGDGINLRYRFGRQAGYSDSYIEEYLISDCCSVLEMMIALAIRCEEDIMDDAGIGDRTSQWFWIMIVNLGLGSMVDAKYDPEEVNEILATFLSRTYEQNGKGNIFYVRNSNIDLRKIEIWHQMCLYLNNIT